MEPFSIRKVVDPHANMPLEIRQALWDAEEDYLSNNSFIDWKVGMYQNVNDNNEDYVQFKIIDNWLLSNFDKDEKVIILYWW